MYRGATTLRLVGRRPAAVRRQLSSAAPESAESSAPTEAPKKVFSHDSFSHAFDRATHTTSIAKQEERGMGEQARLC